MHGDTDSQAVFTDGILTSNRYPAAGAASAGRLALDAAEGVEVISAAAPAEFGHGMGGIMNIVTRSGGSRLHGDAYAYFANRSFSAIGRYALGKELFGKREQAGFNLGGNLPGTTLYFFSNLDIAKGDGHRLNRITNPLIADSTGSRVLASNCTATAAQCSAATRFIQSQMDVLVPRHEEALSGMLKLDNRHSPRNAFGMAIYANQSEAPRGADGEWVSSDGGLLGNAALRQTTRYGKLDWIGIPSGTTTNQFRLSMFYDRLSNDPSATGLSTGTPSIFVAGSQVGEAYADASVMRERRYQLVDNFRASAGSHTFLMGVDLTRTQDWIGGLSGGSGAYYYPSLAAFAKDLSGGTQKNYSYFTQTRGNPVRKLTSPELGIYVQDVWSLGPRWRVTLGARWSKQFLPQPTKQNATYYETGEIRSSNTNIDPRIGIAYQVTGRTVIRTGFGMFHAPHPGELIDALFLGNGEHQSNLLVSPNQTGSPLFSAIVPAGNSAPTGSLNLLYAASKFRNPYTSQTTFLIERQAGGGVTITAGYVGSRGVKLWTAADTNLSGTTYATYTINDAAGSNAGTFETPIWDFRVNSNYAHIYLASNEGASWYRSMVLQVAKRMSRGFSAQAAYTWSHATDNVGGTRTMGGLPLSTYVNDRGADTASSATGQHHRAVVSALWRSRLPGGASPVARGLLNGWEISSIVTLASARRETALVLASGQQFSGINMAFPGSFNGSGGWSRAPFLSIGTLSGDPEYSVNARLSRPIPFSERINARLFFEAFNLFNTQFTTGVNTLAYTATGGVLSPVGGVGAGNSAAGYLGGSNARNCQFGFRFSF